MTQESSYDIRIRRDLVRYLNAYHEKASWLALDHVSSMTLFTLRASGRIHDIAHAFQAGWTAIKG